MSTASRFWIVTSTFKDGEEYLNQEIFHSFDAVCDDVFAAQIEDLDRVVFVDLVAQSSRDVTKQVLVSCSERSSRLQKQPHKELLDRLDAHYLPYHSDEAAEHEARAYDRQVRQDHDSHVRGW